jgi:hypothetical protein
MFRVFLVVAMLGLLTNCVTNGRDFPSDTSWIKKDTTKRDDVKNILGDPYLIGDSGGTVTWTYGYYNYKFIGDSYTKELKMYWNPDNTVKFYSFTSNFPDDLTKDKVSRSTESEEKIPAAPGVVEETLKKNAAPATAPTAAKPKATSKKKQK